MLTNWQQTASLLITGDDLNANVVLVELNNSENNSLEIKNEIENTWKNNIIDTLNPMLDEYEFYTVCIFVAKDGVFDVYRDKFMGNRFINYYWDEICASDGIRIKIFKYTGETKTFIFIKKQ